MLEAPFVLSPGWRVVHLSLQLSAAGPSWPSKVAGEDPARKGAELDVPGQDLAVCSLVERNKIQAPPGLTGWELGEKIWSAFLTHPRVK